MGFFKKRVIRQIEGGVWGHLFNVHKINVDTLTSDIRCVEREGVIEGGKPVKYLRVFKLSELVEKGITVTGWETFDQHPELVLFEGYLTKNDEAFLERKRP